MAVQYAKAAGFETIAVTHTKNKEALVRDVGADHVVFDGDGLKAAGGADVILAPGNSYEQVTDAFKGLTQWGRLVVMGVVFDSLTIPNMGSGGGELIMNSQRIIGSAHEGLQYLAEALDYAGQGKVKPMVEVFAKEQVAEAYDRIASGKVRFCAVVTY